MGATMCVETLLAIFVVNASLQFAAKGTLLVVTRWWLESLGPSQPGLHHIIDQREEELLSSVEISSLLTSTKPCRIRLQLTLGTLESSNSCFCPTISTFHTHGPHFV
ncbi:hypothetical protein EV426DRAFT_615650 [Tirmania nivea]|nr:hypothetical protein EV426DRAFT_615650 [Tirmania nivea]